MIYISPKFQELLRDVLKKRDPDVLDEIADKNAIPGEFVENICQHIVDEICTTGLDDNDEPNERGLLLEELIDRLRDRVEKGS